MHIGLIIYGSLDTLTGGYLYDRLLVEQLRHRGDQVDVISLPWRAYGRHLRDNLSRRLFRRLRQAPFDALLQDELNHPSLFWLNRRLRQEVCYPMVAIVHLLRCSEPRPVWQNWLYRRLETCYLAGLDGLVYNSHTTRTAVEALVGPHRPGVVAYPGGDHLPSTLTPRQIEERAHEPGPLRILFVGNLTPVKGLHTLLQALTSLPPEAWCLTVVGCLTMDPAYVRSIKRQIERSGLSERVRLVGPCPHTAVAAHLARHQVLAVPSLYEAFGIAYLEALGFGLPVIGSTAGAAHELITDGEHGYLVAPGDACRIGHHLLRLHRERQALRRMSLAAHRRARQHPTWSESAGRVRELLQTLTR